MSSSNASSQRISTGGPETSGVLIFGGKIEHGHLKIALEEQKKIHEAYKLEMADVMAALELKHERKHAAAVELLEARLAEATRVRAVTPTVRFFQVKLKELLSLIRGFDSELHDIVQPYCDKVESKDARETELEKVKRDILHLKTLRDAFASRKSIFGLSPHAPVVKRMSVAPSGTLQQVSQSVLAAVTPSAPDIKKHPFLRGGSAQPFNRSPKEAKKSEDTIQTEADRMRQEHKEMKRQMEEANTAAAAAKAELNRFVLHTLMASAGKHTLSKTTSQTSPRSPLGAKVPILTFPRVGMNTTEAKPGVTMPQMSSTQHTMHVKKYKRAVTARTEIMTSMLQKAFKDVDFQAPLTSEPDVPPAPTTIDGYRLCVGAFCSDIHVLIQNFGQMKGVIQDEHERLMATLLHLLGLGRGGAAEPSVPYTVLATLDLTSLCPVFATDRASQLVASLEGDTRWESDVELLRNTWDVLVAHMNQHVKSQMYHLGSLLGSMQRMIDEAQSAKPPETVSSEKKKRQVQKEEAVETPPASFSNNSLDGPHRVMFGRDPDTDLEGSTGGTSGTGGH